jgi:hypothetical protein
MQHHEREIRTGRDRRAEDAQRATLKKLIEKGPLIDRRLLDGARVISCPRPQGAEVSAKIRAAIIEALP